MKDAVETRALASSTSAEGGDQDNRRSEAEGGDRDNRRSEAEGGDRDNRRSEADQTGGNGRVCKDREWAVRDSVDEGRCKSNHDK